MGRRFAILLSGGSGRRMGQKTPKQFLEVKGKPLILYSTGDLLDFGFAPPLVLVAHPDFLKETQKIVREYALGAGLIKEASEILCVAGGATRHDSTVAGVNALVSVADLKDNDILLFHDAARPVIRKAEIARLLGLFENPDCRLASLASLVTETLFSFDPVSRRVVSPIDRQRTMSIKTPQAILASAFHELAQSLADTESAGFTDLLTFGQAGGLLGYLAEAEPSNLKLTHPSDLPLLEKFLEDIN